MNLAAVLASIQPLDRKAVQKAEKRQSQLTKPAYSLGWLEDIVLQVAGITGEEIPKLGKKRVILCAADHGVAEEGVSAYPSSVTPMMVRNFLQGGAAINALARQVRAEVQVVDLGVASELPRHKNLVSAKVALGTRNFHREPAMTPEQLEQALGTGLTLADQAKKDKVRWVVLGEMGIGNTTSAAALMAALLPCAVEDVTGYGTGIDRRQWMVKCRVIQESLKLHAQALSKPLAALQCLGGFEIAALTGLILGCAKNRLPVVVDGFVTSAAFLTAYRLTPKVRDFAFFSHYSEEPGHVKFFELLQTEPLLDLAMRLGEGTGGALALNILEGALRTHSEMATFAEAQVPGRSRRKPSSKSSPQDVNRENP